MARWRSRRSAEEIEAFREKQRVYMREYAARPEVIARRRERGSSPANLAKRRDASRERYASDPEYREMIRLNGLTRRARPEVKEQVRDQKLRRTFGITLIEYREMELAQGGGCAICGGQNGKKDLNVDHNHETGAIRGLLCWPCNSGLGKFGDSIERLGTALRYLEKHEIA